MSHVFDKYARRHGHYPRVVVRNGVQRLTVEFAPGYVRIQTSSPFGGEVYITAATARLLLKQHRRRLLGLLLRQDRSFDVPRAVRKAYLEEAAHSAELRQEKSLRRQADPEKAERQRKRYEAAKRRAR